ncbi:MAG: HD superfamily phosphodieaserase, includes HD domain of RNase Y [Chloroflexi bacterium AL-W]|nr:HD superfamily phosphodieaserase, includes HD domain of RNase Y [Chloroflexi bacterium AL-N1]NOK69099.1 HD superfamily phosphodieaserase, includes HD domain of RNase Y [Chloroflexi bacterium AL-N10]NOK77082.1 HD superfamily phosphodieaserase, includes HD domain of RNase Y [Chloroflexi bacterium AL-N5]NOK83727.1 HD superfamily phosphodieaserase, includes HD domain of RNase Y [Chloroflexi bacterium AL-W]NOK90937.1 HD superfamily phosphodieaserase, includes HD domain of RNase Y [Chloroflexi bac
MYVQHNAMAHTTYYGNDMSMDQPDFERARYYALERLRQELSSHLCYHSFAHTCYEVVPAVERLAMMEGVNGEALLLLRTAAYYHDLGFVEQGTEHEAVGVCIAAEVLPQWGYSRTQVQVISGIIMATRIPQTPQNLLEQLLADADLEVLGRADCVSRSNLLRAEMAVLGQVMDDAHWYEHQIRFFRHHRYWTTSACSLRNLQKQYNFALLQAHLMRCCSVSQV